MENTKFILIKNKKTLYIGTYNKCLYHLQKIQSMSFGWAKKYEGYDIVVYIGKKAQLKNYLLKSIDFTSCGYTDKNDTLKDLYNTAKQELDYINNDRQRTKQRLLGLPSCLDIVFSYYDISELMHSFGYKTKDQYKLNDIYRNTLTSIILKQK